MKEKIYNYIKTHEDVDLHEVLKAIGEEELSVLKATNALIKDGYVYLSKAVPLSETNSDSCRYRVTDKKFEAK